MMDRKLEYDINENIQSPNLTLIQDQAMNVLMLLEKDTEAYKECKKLFKIIDEQKLNLNNIKSLMYLISGKL